MKWRNPVVGVGIGIGLVLVPGGADGQDRLLPPLRPVPTASTGLPTPEHGRQQFEAPALSIAREPDAPARSQPWSDATIPDTPEMHEPKSGAGTIQPIPVTDAPPRQDAVIQPVGFQDEPGTGRASLATNRKTALAQNLIEELSLAADRLIAEFQPMELQDMLANCRDEQRAPMIRQYWSTWQACAEYQFAIDELRWLEQVGQPRDESDRLVLEAAQSMVADVMAEKKLAMTQAQQQLNRYLTGPASETLPWPTDSPLVGDYVTHYGAYAARGSGSIRLQSIHQWLPRQQDLVMSRAATVHRCRNAILHSTQRFRQTAGSSATMLQALYLSRECHSSFLRAVADYNRAIAEYALTVRPGQPAAEQVVAMLIPWSPGTARDPAADYGLRQAALPDSGPYRTPARTYESGGITPDFGAGTRYPASQSPSSPGGRSGDAGFSAAPAFQPPALPAGNGYNSGGSPGFQPASPPTPPVRGSGSFRR